MSKTVPPLKVASVTCYFMPDYVRSRTLRLALQDIPNVTPIIIKNQATDYERYTEVAWKIIKCRFQQKPDVWLLNFRGYEMLPLVLLLAGRKPVIYDEFINPLLVVNEHRKTKTGLVRQLMKLWRVFGWVYYLFLRRCAQVLMDTPEMAAYSVKQSGLPSAKFQVVPLGSDESLFKPSTVPRPVRKRFEVFFYGSGSQPLHGVDTILQAARLLAEDKHIAFRISGNKGGLTQMVQAASNDGANIRHTAWLPFDKFPKAMQRADLCLGGPFGDTVQSNMVVTGKTLQMLACASPVVVGATAATRRDFIDRHNAMMVPLNDPVSLAEAIRWASLHPDELGQIAQNGHRLYMERFSQRVINQRLRQIVRSVAPR